MIIKVTKDNFDSEVLNSNMPALVDFWADWCMPCRMIAPVLEELNKEYDGKIKIAKLNVDEESDIATRYNVVSIPTLLLFKDGKIHKQQIGAAPRTKIEALFSDLL